MQKSTNELKGNAIVATDGEIGNVDDIYIDGKSWTMRPKYWDSTTLF